MPARRCRSRAEHGLALSRLRLRHGLAGPAAPGRRRALCRRAAGRLGQHLLLPSYIVADAFATYKTKYQNLPVIYQLNVKNLFDTVYYPSAVNNLNVAMGDARRVSLSATVKF